MKKNKNYNKDKNVETVNILADEVLSESKAEHDRWSKNVDVWKLASAMKKFMGNNPTLTVEAIAKKIGVKTCLELHELCSEITYGWNPDSDKSYKDWHKKVSAK